MRSVLFALSLCLGLAGVACGHERPNIFEVPKHQPGPNPFVGNKLFVDPNMHSVKQADAWRAQRPEDAALMDKIATQPQAEWLGEWSGAVKLFVRQKMNQYAEVNAWQTRSAVIRPIAHRPAHDSAAGQIHDTGYIQPTFPRREVGDVGNPGLVHSPALNAPV